MVLRLHRCGTATYMTLSERGVPVHAEPEVVFHLMKSIILCKEYGENLLNKGPPTI